MLHLYRLILPRPSSYPPLTRNTLTTLAASRQNQTITLRDRRTLGFAEYGHRKGHAVFYFHGIQGSRLEAFVFDGPAKALGLRVIAVDRPGIGLSSYQRNRRILDWPGDILQLAHQLDLEAFSVLGYSAGCPYALACAKELPRHGLRKAGIWQGMAPLSLAGNRRGVWDWLRRQIVAWFVRSLTWIGLRKFRSLERKWAYTIRMSATLMASQGVMNEDRQINNINRLTSEGKILPTAPERMTILTEKVAAEKAAEEENYIISLD